ncbi:MAG TPA: gamma-glutamyltransferase [Hansschlegelia sp.]
MNGTAVSNRGVVAAPHSAAAETGRSILREGGNAYEAMVGMAATIAVVYPHMNGIGGDGFWLVREPNGKVRYLEACCRAGSRATIALYRDRGYDVIPARGALAALAVPGALNGWRTALELSAEAGGRLPLDLLLGDAIRAAREGFSVSACQARTVPKLWDDILAAPGFAETYLNDGKLFAAGETLKQAKLADTLEHLARVGVGDFYTGDIARELAADLDRIGAPVSREDFAAHRARLLQPLKMPIRGGTIYNSQPPTQGLASLIILGVMERLGVTDDRDAPYVHAVVEATKRAFGVRGRMCVDYDTLMADPQSYLTPERLDREAGGVDPRRAAAFPAPKVDEGDTVWMGAVDKDGRAISYIQSVYWEYGSGCVLPSTGVLMQNRGSAFSLHDGDDNPLAPGRQPFHTLNPPLAGMDDGRVIVYGTMGGEGQPQTQAMIFSRHVWLGMPIDEAIAAPRVRLGRSWGEDDASLRYEPRFDSATIDRLASMGHELSALDEPFSDEVGHAGMIVRDASGRIEGAHDPRADGGAAAA